MEEDQNPLSKPHRDRVGGLARVKLPLPAAPPVTISGGWRRGRNRECPCVGHQNITVVGDGAERIHREESVESKDFICSPSKERGVVWRGTPACNH